MTNAEHCKYWENEEIPENTIVVIDLEFKQVKSYFGSKHNKLTSGGTITFSTDWFAEIKTDIKNNELTTKYTTDHPLCPSHKYFSSKTFIFWKHLRKIKSSQWLSK